MLQLLVGGLANGCVYGLVALGFVLIYKATEGVNFAQGDLMMVGAFVTATLVDADGLGLPFWFGVLLAVMLVGALAGGLEVLLVRPLAGQPQFAMIVLTIALGFVLRFVAGLLWGHEPQSLETPFAGRTVLIGSLVLAWDELFVIVATVVLTGGLYVFFARTRLGLAMQAAAQNQLAAYYVGIPVRRVSTLIWGLAGMTATIAGVLFAARGAIDPNTGLLGIKAFAAAVIGGLGSLPGALLGGLLVGVIEPFAARFAPAHVSQIAPYAVMLAVLVLRPAGLFAQLHGKKV